MENENILKEIIEKKDSLPKKQKVFCDFILDNYRKIGLDSISKMSQESGVGTTTVLRTIHNLGYKNLSDFKKDIHKVVIASQTPKWWDFNDSGDELASDDKKVRDTWEKINLLQKYSMTQDLEKSILESIDLMLEARTINVFGLRTSRSVALYLENSINQFYPICNQLSYEPHFIYDRLYHFKENEIIILIALSPFTQMTYEVAKYCAERNIDIILITDSTDNSIIPFAKKTLLISRTDEHYSMVPAMSLVETLTVMFGSKIKVDSAEVLKDVGSLIANKNITIT